MTDGRVLRVRHLTVYRYTRPVTLGEHRMMFRPRESHDLRLLDATLTILPAPLRVRWLHDVFDNSVAVAVFHGSPVFELRFDSIVALHHLESAPPIYALEPLAHSYPFEYADDDLPDLVAARHRHYPAEAVSFWARRFTSPFGSTGTMALLEAMTLAIRSDFQYVPRVEKGVQHPEQTLRLRAGTCRDFAVLMIEAVRSLGLAARFVSGYIFVPGQLAGQVNGGGATHAWMQVYLPGAGWIDFDPTNSIIGNRNLIRVAVAWDHRQALPLSGSFIGPASSFLSMQVDVTVTEELRPS